MTDSRCLYEVLGVERTASQADIKKVYHRLCLKLHPDKNPGDEEAKAKFQSLQRVYAILGDPQRRAVYDQTGITDEDLLGGDSSEELKAYFKAMFKEVTEDDLDDFYDKYRGSEEERADLLKYYREFKGDMAQVFEWLMCSQPDQDSHRFMATLQQAIDAGEVKAFKAFTRWSKQVASQPAPADPLKKRATGRDRASAAQSHALVALKQKREAAGQAFLAHLEHKYGAAAAGGGKKKKGRQPAEPSEEEFEAARQRLMARAAGDDNKAGAKKKQAAGGQKKGKQRPASSDEDKENESDENDEEEEEEGSESSSSGSEEGEEEEQPARKKAKGGGHGATGRGAKAGAKAAAPTKGKAGQPPTRGVDKKKAPRRKV